MSFAAKQFGQTVVVTFDEEQPMKKTIADKAERDALVADCKEYEKKPSKKLKEKIVKAMTLVKTAKVEKKQKTEKKVAELVENLANLKTKEEIVKKKLSVDDIILDDLSVEDQKKLQAKLNQLKAKQAPEQPKATSGGRRSGEY